VLLINLGTPASPRPADVRRYLREFLSDPQVIDIPAPARWLLLNLVILPFRPRRSAAAYASIWTPNGSPLRLHGDALREALEKQSEAAWRVALAMRYGEPSIEAGLDLLVQAGVDRIVAVPLYPQYATSSTGSTLDRLAELAGRRADVPPIRTAGAFYDHPAFIDALRSVTLPELRAFAPDHLLLSYHGLPERQIRKLDVTGSHCFASEDCCDAIGEANRNCYRAQCFATSRALAAALDLAPGDYSVAFQSRLGRTPWIRPFTDLVLPELARGGVRRLAVMCPSFVADCLETLEEIGIRAREQWLELGGSEFSLIPCLNAHPSWVAALAQIVSETLSGPEDLEVTPERAAGR
jgi:ferrochelatase